MCGILVRVILNLYAMKLVPQEDLGFREVKASGTLDASSL